MVWSCRSHIVAHPLQHTYIYIYTQIALCAGPASQPTHLAPYAHIASHLPAFIAICTLSLAISTCTIIRTCLGRFCLQARDHWCPSRVLLFVAWVGVLRPDVYTYLYRFFAVSSATAWIRFDRQATRHTNNTSCVAHKPS